MLEHFFVKPSTIDRIRGTWLGPQIDGYVEWLETNGYARPTILRRVSHAYHFAAFAQKRGCTEIGEHGISKEACNAKSGRVGPTFGSSAGGNPPLTERANAGRQ